jgi:hypothetical protein
MCFMGALTALGALAGGFACGAAGGDNVFDPSASGGAAGTGGGGTAAGTGTAGTGASALFDAPLGDGGSLTKDSSCASTSLKAEGMPLDMYLMQDSTGSMSSSSKWVNSVKAINGFVTSQALNGDRLALKFFSSDISTDCGGSAYSKPDVPFTPLPVAPGNNPISQALSSHSPGGMTPTEGAIRGVAQFTSANKTAGRVIIGILVTDGDPTDCNENIPALAAIVDQHVKATGIRIFVVGMNGASFTKLETIAVPGGSPEHTKYCGSTSPCHYYNVGNGDPQAFIEALTLIQHIALACEYQMPKADGGTVNPALVTVTYTPGGTNTPQELPRKSSQAECASGDGWYYDNNQSPTKLIMCPGTCTKLQNDDNGQIDVLLGCSDIQT